MNRNYLFQLIKFLIILKFLILIGAEKNEISTTTKKTTLPKLPSMAGRLTSSGIHFFSLIGHKIVDHEFPRANFPNLTVDIPDGPGKGQVFVYDLRVKKFQSPKFQFELAPPEKIVFNSEGGTVKIQGKWVAVYEWLTTIQISGVVDLLASDIRSELTLGAYGYNQRPQLEVFDCTASVKHLEMNLSGGIVPWLVNLFHTVLSNSIKTIIHDQFCASAKTDILDELNQVLRTLPNRLPVAGDFYLDYSYTNDTKITQTYIQESAYIDVLVEDGQKCSIKPPISMELSPPTDDYMLTLWFSSTVFNCLLESFHRANAFSFVINKNMDEQRFKIFLSTSCHWYELCFGKFFPELTEKYPNKFIDLVFHSASPAILNLTKNSEQLINLNSNYFVDFHIYPWKENLDVLARLEMLSNSNVQPKIINDRVGGILNSNNLQLFQVYSKFGNISQIFLNTLTTILNPLIQVAGGTFLRVGVPIPLIEGVQLANRNQLIIFNNILRLDTNLVYASTKPIQFNSQNRVSRFNSKKSRKHEKKNYSKINYFKK